MSVIPITKANFLVGKVLKITKVGLQQIPCAHVRCRQNDYYEHTKMYYTKYTDLWALDSDSKVNIGDTILIRRLNSDKSNTSLNIKHTVERLVFQFGIVIDPITKSQCFQVDDVKNKF